MLVKSDQDVRASLAAPSLESKDVLRQSVEDSLILTTAPGICPVTS